MENTEINAKLKSKPIVMSNIRSSKFQGYDFYHTICSKAKWEKQGNKYSSPQQKAIDKACDGDILLVTNNGKGQSYGSMAFDDLEKIYKQNHYLYELLKDERKFYMDIEFPYENDTEASHKIALIFKLIKKCFLDCGLKTGYKSTRDLFTKSLGVGEQGTFKDIKKFSAHLVLNNETYFKSVFDINKFARYMRQTIDDDETFSDLIFETEKARDYAIDFGVYTKNRLFKLPYQSKPNSNRIQRPAPKTPDSLKDCLISNPIKTHLVDVSNLTLKVEQKSYSVKNKAGKVIGNNIASNVASFLEDYKRCLPDDCPVPEGEPDSGCLEYIVKSMYNGKNVDWSCFCAVGMAICRASGGNDFELWAEWAGRSGKPQNISEMKSMWGRFSTNKGYGFQTLLNMAKLCNPNLIPQHPTGILFELAKYANTNIVNKRYLEVKDFNLIPIQKTSKTDQQVYNPETGKFNVRTDTIEYDVSYIKSPMGTGKSYNIHQIQKDYNRIVYLSSKRAFATAMGKEFEKDGFKNYIDISVGERYDCPKLIISLESFHQINPDNIDLLIIDESESIFNVIGSHTLQAKGEGLNNLLIFEKAIRNARKVLVMDAFLSKRSISAVTTIRPKALSAFTINEWKPPKRTATLCSDKSAMWLSLQKCLSNGERCAVVSGSKKFAIHLVRMSMNEGLVDGSLDMDGIVEGSEDVKLYHSGCPLDLSTNVNEEWSKAKLLVYSPTITCGISYDNPDYHFDRLFVYMPNKFSACFRDAVQALKRVRYFTKDHLFVCLNQRGQYNMDMSPVYFDKVKELIYNWKPKIFTDEKHYISLQDTDKADYKPLKNWVSEARIYNILEQNISGIFIEDVMKKYFELENIEITKRIKKPDNYFLPEFELTDGYSWDEVQLLDYKYNIVDINNKKERGERLTIEEYWYSIYDGYKQTLRADISEINKQLYWDHYILKSTSRSQYYCTIKFHRIIKQKAVEDIYKKTDSKKILELNNFYDERYSHLYKMFKEVGMITEENTLNYSKEFMKEDLEPLLKDYEALRMEGGLKAFNQLLKNDNIREWNKCEARTEVAPDEKVTENVMDTDKMYIMFKHLASDLLGLNAGRIKQKKKRVMVDGKKKQKFFGIFKFTPKQHVVFKRDEEGLIVFDPETKAPVIDKLEELHVLNVAHDNFNEPDFDCKPGDWFNDSGNGSEEE